MKNFLNWKRKKNILIKLNHNNYDLNILKEILNNYVGGLLIDYKLVNEFDINSMLSILNKNFTPLFIEIDSNIYLYSKKIIKIIKNNICEINLNKSKYCVIYNYQQYIDNKKICFIEIKNLSHFLSNNVEINFKKICNGFVINFEQINDANVINNIKEIFY